MNAHNGGNGAGSSKIRHKDVLKTRMVHLFLTRLVPIAIPVVNTTAHAAQLSPFLKSFSLKNDCSGFRLMSRRFAWPGAFDAR
jgi:hypothetical protein